MLYDASHITVSKVVVNSPENENVNVKFLNKHNGNHSHITLKLLKI